MKVNLHAAIRKVLAECGREDLPVVADLDFDHTAPILTLPNLCRAAVDPVNRTVTVLEAAVLE